MATANGVNTALVAANGNRKPGTYDGKTRILFDKYVFPADIFAAADFIKIGELPIGAFVVDAGIKVGDTGTTGAFSLGTIADPDGFIATGDSDGATGLTKKSAAEALIGTQMTAVTDVIVDCTEVTDDAAGVELVAWVEYVMMSSQA